MSGGSVRDLMGGSMRVHRAAAGLSSWPAQVCVHSEGRRRQPGFQGLLPMMTPAIHHMKSHFLKYT